VAKRNYEVISYEGIDFYFKYEADHPDIIHIYARGLFSPADAIEVWFEGCEEIENAEYNRTETYTATHDIYWYWLDQKQTKVFIISCFKRTQK
jgi:hypothetical protein